MKNEKKINKYKKYLISTIILILIIVIMIVLKQKNPDLTSKELIYYFENNNYSFNYGSSDELSEYSDEKLDYDYKYSNLTNNTFSIFISYQTNGEHFIIFYNDKLNDDCYYIESNVGYDQGESTTERKHQKQAYSKWLKENGVTNKQIIELMNYCLNNNYETTKK